MGSSLRLVVRYASTKMRAGINSQLIQNRIFGFHEWSDAASCVSGWDVGLSDNINTINEKIPPVIQNVVWTKNAPLRAIPGRACVKAPTIATQRMMRNNN